MKEIKLIEVKLSFSFKGWPYFYSISIKAGSQSSRPLFLLFLEWKSRSQEADAGREVMNLNDIN